MVIDGLLVGSGNCCPRTISNGETPKACVGGPWTSTRYAWCLKHEYFPIGRGGGNKKEKRGKESDNRGGSVQEERSKGKTSCYYCRYWEKTNQREILSDRQLDTGLQFPTTPPPTPFMINMVSQTWSLTPPPPEHLDCGTCVSPWPFKTLALF